MKQSKFLTYFFLAMLAIGCSNDYDEQTNKPDQDTTANITKSAGDGKYDLIGYGYDIKGEYANASYGKSKIFDVSKIVQLDPNRFEESLINNQTVELFAGSTATEYKKNIITKVSAGGDGFFGLFKASVNANFTQDITNNESFTYASYEFNIEKKELKLLIPAEDYNRFLTINFKEDIERLSPKEIVQLYGTHVLTNITLGARMNILYRGKAQSNLATKANSGSANVKFAAGKIFGLDVSGSNNTSTSEFSKFTQQSLTYKTMGGSTFTAISSMLDITNPNLMPQIELGNWLSSINGNNITLTKINPQGIIPIYNLISDNDIKAANLKKYIETDINTIYTKSTEYTDAGSIIPEDGQLLIHYDCSTFPTTQKQILMSTKNNGYIHLATVDGTNNSIPNINTSVINIPAQQAPIIQSCLTNITSWETSQNTFVINSENNKKYLLTRKGNVKKAYLINNNNVLIKYNFKSNIIYGTVNNLDDYTIHIL